jgi:putative glutamine amidotransferase
VVGVPRIGITSEPLSRGGRRTDSSYRDHVDGVVAGGGVPVILPVLDPSLVEAALEGIDGLLLTGGGDIEPSRYRQPAAPEVDGVDPARDDFELALVCAALESGLPILGISRGHQLVNVALGGTLHQHVPTLTATGHEEPDRAAQEVHRVRIASGSLLAAVVGSTSLGVNSAHHQVVELAGAGLQVVARSEDGLIEAVEGLGDLRVLGVQWQPELLRADGAQAALFGWLVREAAVPPVVDLTEPSALAEVGPRPAVRAGRAVA